MIGPTLRRLRLSRGLTQTELAQPRYTHAYVSAIETGRRRPSREVLEHFAQRLGVGVEELETGQAPPTEARLRLRLHEALVALSAGRTEQADRSFRAVARAARRLGLASIQAGAEEGRGMLLERQDRPEEALERYEEAERILLGEPPTALVDAVAGKARCFHSLGDVRYEIHILESLLERIRREKLFDPNALARVHAGLVYAYLDAGLYAKAAESAAELERLSPRLTDPLRVAQMHLHVARLSLVQGRVQDAERSLQRAEDAYRQLGLRTETGYAHLARGYVLSRAGRNREARQELERALAIFEETGDRKDLTRSLNELARIDRLDGRPDSARELLERSIRLIAEADVPIAAWAHRELGLVLAQHDPAGAEKNLRLAIELYEQSEQSVDIAVTYRALGDFLGANGDAAAGCEAYRTGIMRLEPRL